MRLEHEGVVTMDPGKGAVVSEISKIDLAEIYPIVSAMEGLAARLLPPTWSHPTYAGSATESGNVESGEGGRSGHLHATLNSEFHQTYIDRCTNQRLCNLVFSVKEQIYRFRIFSLNLPNRMNRYGA